MKALKKTETNLNLEIEKELKEKFMILADLEGTNTTKLLTDFIHNYINKKFEENGIYSLLLSKNYLENDEEKELISLMKELTKEDMKIAYEEIIEI